MTRLLLAPVLFFAWSRSAAQLPVVVGTVDTTPRALATHTVTVLDSAQLRAMGGMSVAHAISGKVAGARVVGLSGAPGGASAVVLRAADAQAVTDPLVIVDGIASILSLTDLRVDDLERVEILKGAAATAVYGFGAANGVVRIITKRGRDAPIGRTVLALRSDVSQNSRPRVVPTSMHHAYVMDASGNDFLRDVNGNRIAEPDGIHDNDYPRINDAADALFRSALLMSNHVSLRHKRDEGWFGLGDFYASLAHERDEGIVDLKGGRSRKAGRFTLDRTLGRFAFDGGFFYSSAESDLLPDLGGQIALLRSIEPHAKLDSMINSGACFNGARCHVRNLPAGQFGTVVNPLFTIESTRTEDKSTRLVLGANAAYWPRDWLGLRIGFTEQGSEDLLTTLAATPGALAFQRDATRKTSTSTAMVTLSRELPGSTIRNTTRLGWINERIRRTRADVSGGFATTMESRGTLRSLLLATAFDLGRGVNLDGSVRRDEVSAAAPRAKPIYHRIGASYQPVAALTLRAATGTTGSAVPPDAEAVFVGGSGSILRLPFVRENEYGARATLPRGIAVEYVHARQRTSGYVWQVPTPASTGFTLMWSNVGVVESTTHEATLGVPLLAGDDHGWRLDIVAFRTRSVLSRLTTPEFVFGNQVQFRARAGEELGTIYGTRWIRSDAQLNETISTGQLPGPTAGYVRNAEGYFVRLVDHGTMNERPLVYYQCESRDPAGTCTQRTARVTLGRVTPDMEFGVTNTARWRSLSLYATLSGAVGGVINNSARHSTFLARRDVAFDQAAKPLAERKPWVYYLEFASLANGVTEYFLESGSHLKLREFALEYLVPRRWHRLGDTSDLNVGLIGRNLFTSSDYTGHDPDVVVNTGSVFDYRTDTFTHPVARTLGVRVRASF
jgi:TonB-dependent SusC/RagA subfamily outer membrane receptor